VTWLDDVNITITQGGLPKLVSCTGTATKGYVGSSVEVKSSATTPGTNSGWLAGVGKAKFTCTLENGVRYWKALPGSKVCGQQQTVTKLKPQFECSYPSPPSGCSYVPGTSYDASTQCGMKLVCTEILMNTNPPCNISGTMINGVQEQCLDQY
jgi:hypothetical protein